MTTTTCEQPDDIRVFVTLFALITSWFFYIIHLKKKVATLQKMYIDVQLELNAVYDNMDEGIVFVPKEKRNNKFGWMFKGF